MASQPEDDGGGDDDGGHEGLGATVVAGGDAAPVLETAEHVLDLVAEFVERAVVGVLDLAGLARRDAGRDVLVLEHGAVAVAVVALVGDENVGLGQRIEQDGGAFVVADLASRQQQRDGAALAVTDGMQL